jgi:DNA-binding MarR family transcriptional regulator
MKKLQGKQERWVKIYHRILSSPSFTELSYSASRLYLDLRMLLSGTNNGNICATLSTLRHRGWSSPTTLAKNLRQLEAVGLIAKTRRTTGVENGSKMCNLYRFTDEPCYEWPALGIPMKQPTNDFERFRSRAEARAALKAATPPKKKVATQSARRAPESVEVESANATQMCVAA